jgi:hypothetical protein
MDSLLKPSAVAALLGVPVSWVRDHSERAYPRLPIIRVGGLLRYQKSSHNRLMETGSLSWLASVLQFLSLTPVRKAPLL